MASAESFVLRSATTGPVHLIAHSFGVHAALEIVRRQPDSVRSLVLIAPCVDPLPTFTNILRLAREDLAGTKPDIASTIAASLERTRSVMDDPMREGMLGALHDERLFTHYWADQQQFQASMAALARAGGQFDAESFFAVLSDFGHRVTAMETGAVRAPTLALFGAADRITPAAEQRTALQAALRDAKVEVLDRCSHFVHLDRPRDFVDRVVQWAGEAARGNNEHAATGHTGG